MLLIKLNLFDSQNLTKVTTPSQITLKPFQDFNLNIMGWYALGHHRPQQFIAAMVEQELNYNFSPAQVQLAWAKFRGHNFEVADLPVWGSQAITLVESWGKGDPLIATGY